MALEVIVLAAGIGSRMRSNKPKVLHQVGGKPMLLHVLEVAQQLKPLKIHVVAHPTMLEQGVNELADQVNWVAQEKQLGSGHAAVQALPYLQPDSSVLIINGDGPLVTHNTLNRCVLGQEEAAVSIISAKVADPTGYGRIFRGPDNEVLSIVEDADLSAEQRDINEVNSGIVCTSAALLRELLPKIKPQNQQKEIYLTDLVALAQCSGQQVSVNLAEHPDDILGVNNHRQLAQVERIFQRRQAEDLLDRGVSLADPNRIDIRGSVQAGQDCQIDVNVVLEGDVELADGVKIGPNSVLRNVRIGRNTEIRSHTVVEDAAIGQECAIGPFARIRPGSEIADDVRIGNFVELKNAQLDDGVRAGHLAYLGDVKVGRDTNIGAGAITCNFDGQSKHQTSIGDRVFIGTNASLVAPLIVGDDAFVAAGSTITRDVEPEAFAIARARQRDIAGGATRLAKS